MNINVFTVSIEMNKSSLDKVQFLKKKQEKTWFFFIV